MWEDPVFNNTDDAILSIISDGKPNAVRIQQGIYEIQHFNFDSLISKSGGNLQDDDDWIDGVWETCYETVNSVPWYGVCDSIEEFLSDHGDAFEKDERCWCISFTEIRKDEQPSEGGWRWHKWGEYIGKKEPQYEYLYDEGDDIERVYVFSVFMKRVQ